MQEGALNQRCILTPNSAITVFCMPLTRACCMTPFIYFSERGRLSLGGRYFPAVYDSLFSGAGHIVFFSSGRCRLCRCHRVGVLPVVVTPLRYRLFGRWTEGEDRPKSGSLVQLVTKDGKTELVNAE